MQKVPKLGLNYRKYSENMLGLPKIYRKYARVTEIRVRVTENIQKIC